jgi:hypothetical protein
VYVIYCGLMMILRVGELEFYRCLELFRFPYCSRVHLLLFKVLMCRSIVSLKCGKGKPCLLKERLELW